MKPGPIPVSRSAVHLLSYSRDSARVCAWVYGGRHTSFHGNCVSVHLQTSTVNTMGQHYEVPPEIAALLAALLLPMADDKIERELSVLR